MTMDLLRLIAASPLPAISYVPEEITAIKALRSAGLLVAWTTVAERPPSPAARDCAMILAITEKGRKALRDFALRSPFAPSQNEPPMSAEATGPITEDQPQLSSGGIRWGSLSTDQGTSATSN